MDKLIRYFMIVEGRVQRVGFRSFCQLKAYKTNITGHAKNLDNGMVEIEAQANKETLLDFIDYIKKGNLFIKVDNISIKEIPIKENEKKFISI
ncbi:MAG: acylphosphatase [Erysipelotrichaceae bacterium]|nr:acylphosphatase [Erysipelotrichaceae bacterium]